MKKILALMLGGIFVLGAGVPVAQAMDRHERCELRERNAERHLNKAIRRHGVHSRQAAERRRELAQARRSCW